MDTLRAEHSPFGMPAITSMYWRTKKEASIRAWWRSAVARPTQLMAELTMYKPEEAVIITGNISQRIQLMQIRYDSPGIAKMLDTYARVAHLTQSLLSNPAKLRAYLRLPVAL